MNIAIIIPAYNEEAYLENCLLSLLEQSYPAQQILVVDDGSTDRTPEILNQLSSQHSNLNFISKAKSYQHEAGSKIIQAFNFGLAHLNTNYDILCKFDADLIFPKDYLEILNSKYENQPKLGMFGGFCYIKTQGQWKLENLTNEDHIRGALKSYRKTCFKDIDGLVAAMGWDTIDEMKARYKGWIVKTEKGLLVKHLKPTGTLYAKALPKAFGESLFRMRYSLTLAFITCFKMAIQKKKFSFFITSFWGFLKGNSKKNSFLIGEKEGAFIRAYRWNKIKERLI